MNSDTSARISSVTITTGQDEQAFTVDPEAGGPQSVTVTMADGKKVTVNADGGIGLEDGRTVIIGADGSIQVSRRKAAGAGHGKHDVTIGPGARGVQFGTGNTQVNAF